MLLVSFLLAAAGDDRPGSDLFVVYNEERDILGGDSLPRKRELLVKVTFYFVPF